MKAHEERKRAHSSIVSASEAIRWVRLSSPVSGSCRDSFTNCSSRAWRSLLTRTTPCARAGRPSAPANQQPVSSIQITGAEVEAPHAIFDPVGHALAAPRGCRLAECIGSDRALRLDQLGELRAACERSPAGCPEKSRPRCRSRQSRRSRDPRRKSLARARRGCWRLAGQRASSLPRFGTPPGDSSCLRIVSLSDPTLGEVDK